MEDQENQEKNVKETTPAETQKETIVVIEEGIKSETTNGASTSRDLTETLPGAVSSPKLFRTGLSKSEHCISRVITKQDVANALKLTSISFGATNSLVKNLNLKDLKVPTEEKRNSNDVHKVDSTTMMELKTYMASCFKFNKETPTIASMPEVPVRIINAVASEIPELPNIPSSSCAQTDEPLTVIVTKANEVIITNPPMSKISSEKKKTSENLSEKSDLGLANRDSLSSIGSNVCRICMTRGRERLISPCNCKGSLANVHLSCLERWLNQVGRNHCELCGFSYPAIRTPRYTVLQALRLWFGNPRNRSHLQSDCLIFWLLSTVTAGLLAVCIVGTQYFVIEGNKFGKSSIQRNEQGISHRITETAMDFFMAVVICGYSVTVYLLWKDHFVMWNRWRRTSVNVRLLLTPDSNPVPFVPRPRYNVV